MLTFKPIALQDRDLINSYLCRQHYRASDLS